MDSFLRVVCDTITKNEKLMVFENTLGLYGSRGGKSSHLLIQAKAGLLKLLANLAVFPCMVQLGGLRAL